MILSLLVKILHFILAYFSIKKEEHGVFQEGIVKLRKQISIDFKRIYQVNVTVSDGKNTNQVSRLLYTDNSSKETHGHSHFFHLSLDTMPIFSQGVCLRFIMPLVALPFHIAQINQ
jgi:hypothetical protein